eukprot:CAMPEP_0168330718 /NCGR_PEP_ID=MMETSP0213-20121227/7905_1 /TAXON_ID=151035 /ORGANISM="Euplotes harpa, Strain FSP1.4" /LENGTH=294 /DNA_ID=CAMNT_0008334357 /DNA_START=2692 /DNA_END=3573 /DNA_ORIENTATION=-
MTLEFTFEHTEFRTELSQLMWMLYNDVGLKDCPCDENWKDLSKVRQLISQGYDERSQREYISISGMKRINDFESDAMSEQYSMHRNQMGKKNSSGRHVIKLNTLIAPGITNPSASNQNESLYKSEISYGSDYIERGNKRRRYAGDADESYIENESQIGIVEDDDYDNMDWKDCCLRIIDKIEEFDESEDFKLPVTKEDYGEYWEEYKAIITYPIDLASIRAKIYEGEYVGVGNFEFDMRKVFDNCKKFNEPGSTIYENAVMLEDVFSKIFKPIKKKFGESKKLKEAGISITMGG